MSWSFIISTDGKNNNHFHPYIIDSIKKQNIPNYEIIFVTENKEYNIENVENVKMVYCNDNKITIKKNLASTFAVYDNLCFLHDYIILSDNWYDSFKVFGYDWNVCIVKFLNSNGARWWDWCVIYHPQFGHTNVSYNTPLTDYHYAPGNGFCVKRDYFLKNKLDEKLGWGEGEDVEWSHRINKDWNYKINLVSYFQFLKFK